MKGKRGLALVLSLLAISLTSCSEDYTYPDAVWKDGHIVTIGGKEYTFDNVYTYFEDTKSSAQAYFSVAKSVIAQSVTTVTAGIKSLIDTKMSQLRDTWKTNARTNGTSYKEEQEKTFDSEGVEDEDELIAKYTADEQVSENSTAFYNVETTSNGQYYISEEQTKKYVEDNAPYHVSHILIKVDASSDGAGLYNGQISSDDAKQIASVTRMLSTGLSFGDTALLASDDSSSNTQYGELYTRDSMIAMQKDTSYVNEFKLGVYAYDTFLNNNIGTTGNKSKADVASSLRVPGSDKDKGYVTDSKVSSEIDDTLYGENAAFGIPLSVCFQMNQIAEMETNPSDGSTVTTENKKTVTASQYPRNVLFNNYFNYRGVSFIYNDSDSYDQRFLDEFNAILTFQGKSTLSDISGFETFVTSSDENKKAYGYKLEEYKYVKAQLEAVDSNRFVDKGVPLYGYHSAADENSKTNSDNTLTQINYDNKILCDEKGNPIIIARAGTSGDSGYQGIHFIVVNNDPFTADSNGDVEHKHEYYRVNIPSESSTDNMYSKDYSAHPSFINFVNADSNSNTTYNSRRSSIESVIKASFDSEEIELYNYNKAKFKESYGYDFDQLLGSTYADKINYYITLSQKNSKETSEESLDSSWETYIRELNIQTDYSEKRMIPTICVAAFESGEFTAAMEEVCYVA